MKKNDKIMIQFFGLSGSGKSTICNLLMKSLNEHNISSITGKQEMFKYKKILRHLYPILFYPLKTFNTIIFLINSNKFIYKKNKYKISFKIFKNIMLENFIYKNSNYLFFINDGALHHIINNIMINKYSINKILNLYSNNTIFIFLDTPPETSIKRRSERDNKYKFNKKNLAKEYKVYKNNISAYNSLKEIKDNYKVIDIIKLNGLNSPEYNTELIKKIILKNEI